MAALLFILLLAALFQFFRMTQRPELDAGRFTYLAIALGLGVIYAIWRGVRALRRLQQRGGPE